MASLDTLLDAGRMLMGATIKGSALIVVVAMIQWIGREKIPAGWRYALWLVVIARLLMPIAPESPFSMFNFFAHAPSTATLAFEEGPDSPRALETPAWQNAPAATKPSNTWPLALLAIWAAGALSLAVRSVAGSMRLAMRIHSDGRRSADPRLSATVRACAQELGIRRHVGIVETSAVGSPALHGIFRPKLLVPPDILEVFSEEELRYIVLHELAHLRRADVPLNVVAAIVECLHWFNPLVWIALARMREERELACDRAALARIPAEARAQYGRTVLKLIDCLRTPASAPALVGMASRQDEMKRRILMIAAFRKSSRASLAFAAVVALLGFASLTDAETVKHRIMKMDLSPEAKVTFERLSDPVTVEFKEAAVLDVAQSVAGKAGVTVTVAPEVAATVAAAPRVSLTAENLPAHVALMETLASVDLGLKFTATGIEITRPEGAARRMIFIGEHGMPHQIEEDRVVVLDGETASEQKIDGEEMVVDGEERKVERIVIKHRDVEHAEGEVHAEGEEIHQKKVIVIDEDHEREHEGATVRHLEDARLEIKVHKK